MSLIKFYSKNMDDFYIESSRVIAIESAGVGETLIYVDTSENNYWIVDEPAVAVSTKLNNANYKLMEWKSAMTVDTSAQQE